MINPTDFIIENNSAFIIGSALVVLILYKILSTSHEVCAEVSITEPLNATTNNETSLTDEQIKMPYIKEIDFFLEGVSGQEATSLKQFRDSLETEAAYYRQLEKVIS